MSYNSNTKIISAPVSVQDVRECLGESSYDIGTLCKSSHINPTARYKPFKGGTVGVQVNYDNPIPSNALSGWKTGSEFSNGFTARAAAAFGLQIPTLTFDSDGFPKQGQKWSHNKPTGGSSEPYRLTDFNGYIHTPANCWHIQLNYAPHFAFRFKDTTGQQSNVYTRFSVSIYPFKDDGSGSRDLYYVTLQDIAVTALANPNQLYLWVAIIATSSNTRNGLKSLYAKRSTLSLAEIFSNGSFPITVIDLDTKNNFKNIISTNNSTPTPVFDTESGQNGLYNIKGDFDIQCFIGPKINNDGLVSSIYNVEVNHLNFNATYGLGALQNAQVNCLSLAGMTLGSDINTIKYLIKSWNTGLTQYWSNSNPSSVINCQKSSSNGKTIYTISSSLYFTFYRSSIKSDYIDVVSNKVYYSIDVTYYVTPGYSYTLGTSTTAHTGEYTVRSTGSEDIDVGYGANHNIPIQNVTVNGNYSGLGIRLRIYRGGSLDSTTLVLEYTLSFA